MAFNLFDVSNLAPLPASSLGGAKLNASGTGLNTFQPQPSSGLVPSAYASSTPLTSFSSGPAAGSYVAGNSPTLYPTAQAPAQQTYAPQQNVAPSMGSGGGYRYNGNSYTAAPASSGGGASGGYSGGGGASGGGVAQVDPYAQARAEALAALDADYAQQVTQLSGLESQTRAGASQANTDLSSALKTGKSQADLLQKNSSQQLGLQSAQAGTDAESALSSARRAAEQMAQRNNAYLSSGGITNSSVAEALEQQLGQGSSLAVNQIQSNKDSYIKALDTELTRVKDYVSQQTSDLEAGYKTAVDNVNLELQAALGRINEGRNLATNQKAQARQNILNNAQGVIKQIEVKAASFSEALQAFAHKQSGTVNNLANFAVSIPGSVDFMKSVNDLVASGYDVPTFLNDYAGGRPRPYVSYYLGQRAPLKPTDPNAPQG